MIHFLGVIAATTVITLGTLLPFFPGSYDSLAAAVSLMSRIFGTVGLLLVPVAALWIAAGYWSRMAGKQYGIAIAALIASSVVWLCVSLGGFVESGPLFGLASLALWIYVLSRVLPRLRHLKGGTPRRPSAAAFYLFIVPVAVALLQMAVLPRAIAASRNRAIQNSAQLIADIEQYRAAHGRYPGSLLSVWPDYKPGVIGIKEYHYEPSGDSYNLLFEQIARDFGTREFVVYNPVDQQVMTSHKMDLLQLTPGGLELERSRGYHAVRDAPHPHWKYFWFD